MSNRILVIEDNPDSAELAYRALTVTGYEVRVTPSGAEGLTVAREWQPDLVVLDVIMSGMDGFEVCRQMRADPRLADLPILFLTALGQVEDRVEGLRAGADDYLAKPCNPDEFVLRVQAILRRVVVAQPAGDDEPAGPLVRGDLVLDSQKFTIQSPRGTASLPPAQFELLGYLMNHIDEVISPARLLREVWNYPPNVGEPELVRVSIRRLREKIEPDPSRPIYLVTVPGHGYRLRGHPAA
jgi:two-component system, OmpR family, response regulator RpaA